MIIRRYGRRSLFLAVLLVGVTSSASWARECSLKTLQGRYGFVTLGTIVVTSPQLPFASVGVVNSDGNGNLSGTFSQSLAGGTATGLKLEGTYQVNPDCTLSVTLPATGAHRTGVITGEGMQQEIHLIFADPGAVASVVYKKSPQGRCSLATLKGTYGLFGNGTILPPGAPPVLVAQAGILTLDGAGNFSGEDTASTAGQVIAHRSFTGTYTVNSDCTASVVINSDIGITHEEGVITGAGESQEFHGIITDAGWVFTNTVKKQ